MRLYLAVILLLSSVITYSQTKDKDLLKLLDSIRAVDPYQSLNSQVNELREDNVRTNLALEDLKDQYESVNEFYMRQELYRKVFDQIELEMIPDQSELIVYNDSKKYKDWYFEGWSLVQFPKTDSNQSIVVYIDAKLEESQNHGKYPIQGFILPFYKGDALLKKRYPKIFSMIESKKIIFTKIDFSPEILLQGQAPSLKFPTNSSSTSNSLDTKQKYANDLLLWISTDLSKEIMIKYDRKRDVAGDYKKIEKKAYTKATIDQQIELRVEYIEFLRLKYKMVW